METIPQTQRSATEDRAPGEFDEQANRPSFAELVADADPVLNLHGQRLDQLPTLTLGDHLAEVDAAVADGVCGPDWARQARRIILGRHQVDPTPPTTDDDESDSDLVIADEDPTETTGADPPAIGQVVEKLAEALADKEISDEARRCGEAVVKASFDRSSAADQTLGLGPDDVEGLVAEVDYAVLDDPHRRIERRRPRAERRLGALVVDVAGPLVDEGDNVGYFLLCADAGEALGSAVDRLARYRAAKRAEAVEAERRESRQAERAVQRRRRPRRYVEIEPMEPVRPHVEVDEGPTLAQREDLALALALAAQADPTEAYAAMALVRETAVAAKDHHTAAWAKAKLRQLRKTVA